MSPVGRWRSGPVALSGIIDTPQFCAQAAGIGVVPSPLCGGLAVFVPLLFCAQAAVIVRGPFATLRRFGYFCFVFPVGKGTWGPFAFVRRLR